jgi:hypothetical protein
MATNGQSAGQSSDVESRASERDRVTSRSSAARTVSSSGERLDTVRLKRLIAHRCSVELSFPSDVG